MIITDVEFEAKKVERKGGPRGKRKRTEAQARWDEPFRAAWEAGRPFAVQIHPDEADSVRKHVISSARYFDLGVTEGVPQPGREEDTVILVWKIREVKKRGPRNKTSDSK